MDIIKKKLESITRGVYLKYDTLKIFSLDEINSLIRNTKQNKPLMVEEFKLHKYSHRYLLFMRDKQECVVCGAKASFWALQRVGDLTNPHLNLWGFDRNNEIVLFTKDHIIPKAKGGKNNMSNYQIMCDFCNGIKGDDYDE